MPADEEIRSLRKQLEDMTWERDRLQARIDLKDKRIKETFEEVVRLRQMAAPARVLELEDQVRQMREALERLMEWGVEFDDERLKFITVQVDRSEIVRAQSALSVAPLTPVIVPATVPRVFLDMGLPGGPVQLGPASDLVARMTELDGEPVNVPETEVEVLRREISDLKAQLAHTEQIYDEMARNYWNLQSKFEGKA
jgi:hypothetical protein